LALGTENAVSNLSVENGFFGNQALKLLLPEEAQIIVENISLIPGVKLWSIKPFCPSIVQQKML
jgi:hypothetical protein